MMKRYDDLTEEQKKLAFSATLSKIISGLMCGTVTIKLKHDMHQRLMTKFLERGMASGDYSKFHEFTKRSIRFKEEVIDMTEFSIKNAYYTEPREFVLYGIAG
jgi:hypothetical protein